jgi:hypothetical protein
MGLLAAKNGRGERARDRNAIEVNDDSCSDIIIVEIGN